MLTIKDVSNKYKISKNTIHKYLKIDPTFKACAVKPFNKWLFNEILLKQWIEKHLN